MEGNLTELTSILWKKDWWIEIIQKTPISLTTILLTEKDIFSCTLHTSYKVPGQPCQSSFVVLSVSHCHAYFTICLKKSQGKSSCISGSYKVPAWLFVLCIADSEESAKFLGICVLWMRVNNSSTISVSGAKLLTRWENSLANILMEVNLQEPSKTCLNPSC